MTMRPVIIWLLTGAILVASMVLIGGITRLTHSGLSMVEWRLIMGALPPMSQDEWNQAFEKYQQFPEYQKLNRHFNLADFKSIFYWEYIHRLLGRITGIVFIFPFLFFWYQKKINRTLLLKLFLIFVFGAFQAFLGWFMVKSGLVDQPSVSHLRLAVHLIAAFLLCAYIIWVVLGIKYPEPEQIVAPIFKKGLKFLFLLLTLQIIFGGFVAGLKAGYFYPTFPLMGGSWYPTQINDALASEGLASLINNITTVHFIHRWLGVIIFFFTIGLRLAFSASLFGKYKRNLNLLVLAVTTQALLGVTTLLLHVPVMFASMHQVMALITLLILVINLHPWRQIQWISPEDRNNTILSVSGSDQPNQNA